MSKGLALSEDVQEVISLVERISKGDKNAEFEMIKKYQEGLYIVLRSKIFKGKEDILDDVIQDTWQIVLEKVRKNDLKAPEKLPAFIISVGNFQLLMYARKQDNSRLVLDETMDQFEGDNKNDPYSQLFRHRAGQLVRNLIAKLKKPRDREILNEYYINEYSKESICENHDLDEKHFHKVLFRARERLKKLLKDEQIDHEEKLPEKK